MTSTGLGGLAIEEAARAALRAGEVSLVMRDFLVGGADPRAAASVLLAMLMVLVMSDESDERVLENRLEACEEKIPGDTYL